MRKIKDAIISKLLGWLVEMVKKHGITEIKLITNYDEEAIASLIAENRRLEIELEEMRAISAYERAAFNE